MKYLPFDARVVLIDGPVAVFLHEANEQTILDAFDNLRSLVAVAAQQLDTGECDDLTRSQR